MRRALAIATAVLAGATLVAQGASAVSIDAATRTCLRTTYGVGATRAIVAAKTLTAQQRARVQRCKAAVATTTTAAPATTTTAATTTTTTTTATTTTVAADRTKPTLTFSTNGSSSTSSTLTFLVTGDEAITCSTLSKVEGEDFNFLRISRIDDIRQTSTTVCTITAQSTAPRDNDTYESRLTVSSTFSLSDTAGNVQTTMSPTSKSIWVTRAP